MSVLDKLNFALFAAAATLLLAGTHWLWVIGTFGGFSAFMNWTLRRADFARARSILKDPALAVVAAKEIAGRDAKMYMSALAVTLAGPPND